MLPRPSYYPVSRVSRVVGKLFSKYYKTQETIFDVLLSVVKQRLKLQNGEKKGHGRKEKAVSATIGRPSMS